MASVKLRWWGFRVRLTHQETQAMFGLAEKAGPIAGTAVTALLTAGGVAAGPAGLIAGLLALVFEAYAFWILSQDDGNGVALWISWNGTLFWVENP